MSAHFKKGLVEELEGAGWSINADAALDLAYRVCNYTADAMEKAEPYAHRDIAALRSAAQSIDLEMNEED